MNLVPRYEYQALERVTLPSGVRHYLCPQTGDKLPSVTTIISATEDKTGLMEWKKRVGETKAEQVKKEATDLGSLMHTHLENYILGRPRPGGTNMIRVWAQKMADQIILHGLADVEEVWGSEVALYYPKLFAGTTDVVGVYQGRPAIMDFKTAKKMRSRPMIEGYMNQLAAYGIAHNELYNTNIETGVIFMVTRDYEFQAFVISGKEFREYEQKFLDRLEHYLTH